MRPCVIENSKSVRCEQRNHFGAELYYVILRNCEFTFIH